MNWNARYALINVARSRVGLRDNADWRTVLKRIADVDSVKQLDDASFDRLMDHFRSLGFVSDKRQQGYNRAERGVMASAGQIDKICGLWSACTNGEGTEGGLRTFVTNKTGASDLRFVDRRGAHILITALTSWKLRNEKRAADAIDGAG